MTRFIDQLKSKLGDQGYDYSVRRSVQTAILYEAFRCISDKLPSMRPFQRKAAFFDQARAILEATGFSLQSQVEIMWRTASSKEALTPEGAWKRVRHIEKEMDKIRQRIKPFCEEGKSHEDIVDDFVQKQFEQVTGNTGKNVPAGWEHSHNNVIMAYRMFFRGDEPDPNLPSPVPFKEVVVPVSKPREDGITEGNSNYFVRMPSDVVEPQVIPAAVMPVATSAALPATTNPMSIPAPTLLLDPPDESADDRMAVLQEIRVHMDLLKEFAGIIPHEELTQRKRQLYQAMPEIPPTLAARAIHKRRCVNDIR